MAVEHFDEVDELFGDDGDRPAPRSGRVMLLLVSGLLTGTAGLLCTAVPGAVLVLLAWLQIENELDRVESGYLPVDVRPRLLTLRRITYAGVGWTVLILVVQAILLFAGVYHARWEALIHQLGLLLRTTM